MEELEIIYEGIEQELDAINEELEKKSPDKQVILSATKNLDKINDKIYECYENSIDKKYLEEVEKENEFLKELLYEFAKDDLQKIYDLKFKYGIE